jgi:hypothetical protein
LGCLHGIIAICSAFYWWARNVKDCNNHGFFSNSIYLYTFNAVDAKNAKQFIEQAVI